MKRTLAVAALALCAAAPSLAAKAVSFQYKDWELRCDNTLTCRAAGYQGGEGSSDDPVSMRLTRAAGPSTPIEIDVQTGGDDDASGRLRLRAGKLSLSGIDPAHGSLDAAQVRSLLPELLKGETVAVADSKNHQWALSLAGLNAVLLKMDDVQGRIGTPGALSRKGSRPESSVQAPVPAPVVNAARLPKTQPADKALAARIFPALDTAEAKESCNNKDEINAKSMEVARLDGHRVLLSLGCGMGAYNYSTLLWIANDKPPYAPVALEANGDLDEKTASVSEVMKGRGIGDCISTRTWTFDGKTFVLTSETGDGMCRGFAGGAWGLPGFVARVVPAPAR